MDPRYDAVPELDGRVMRPSVGLYQVSGSVVFRKEAHTLVRLFPEVAAWEYELDRVYLHKLEGL